MRSLILVVAGVLGVAGCIGGIETNELEQPPPYTEPNVGCALGCHGSDTTNSPPSSVSGATDTTATAVGAHRSHMNVAATWHRPVECTDCHLVPAAVGDSGHMDGDNKAEVTFSAVAQPGMWNGTTCTTRCHGNAAWGGSKPVPTWTQVDGTQATCGSCHAMPPPAPHPADSKCASCHPTMEEGGLTFRDPLSHINGVIDMTPSSATGGCTSCHGSTNSAPPKDLSGNTVATARGVGAHQAHLKTATWHRAVTCSNCHVVPTTSDAPGHRDGDNVAEVKFDTLNPAGVYTAATTTCATQYCHGNGRGSNGTVSWVTPGALACTSCHQTNGTGMSGDHRKHIVGENLKCSQCHGDVVNAAMTITNANLHVNGVHEVKMAAGTYNATTRACSNTGCHGTETW